MKRQKYKRYGASANKICKFCGKTGLLWALTQEDKWVLLEKDKSRHDCPKSAEASTKDPLNIVSEKTTQEIPENYGEW